MKTDLSSPSRGALVLDVNVLLALAWPNHPFYRAARKRLEDPEERWATCALTQLSFIRLSSNPAVIPHAVSPFEAVTMIQKMTEDPAHIFLEKLPAPMSPAYVLARGHQQVTDAYLASLATSCRGRLLTFDTRLRGLSSDVEVLS